MLDLLAKDIGGRRYNIEMKVRRYHARSARRVYDLARTLTGQLKSGEDYQSLKPVIEIHLLEKCLGKALRVGQRQMDDLTLLNDACTADGQPVDPRAV